MQRIVYRIGSAAALRELIEQGAASRDGASKPRERAPNEACELPLGELLEDAVQPGAWVLATFEVASGRCDPFEAGQAPPSRRPLCASARVIERDNGSLFAQFDAADWQRIERYVSARFFAPPPCEEREPTEAPPPSRTRSERPEALFRAGPLQLDALRVVFAGVGGVRAQCLGGVAACVEVDGEDELEAHVLQEQREGRAVDALVLQGEAETLCLALRRVRPLLPRAPVVCVVPVTPPQQLRALVEAGADEVLPRAVRAAEVAATLLALVRRRSPRGVLSSGVA